VVVDPGDPNIVWATVEVDGLHRSTDGGDTWMSLGALGGEAFYNDVHGLETVVTPSGRDLLVTTPFGLGRSIDDGETFDWHEFDAFAGSKLGVAYSRCVRAPWDDVIVVCVGDYVPGRIGALEISRARTSSRSCPTRPCTGSRRTPSSRGRSSPRHCSDRSTCPTTMPSRGASSTASSARSAASRSRRPPPDRTGPGIG
jgi:hypothetical protein